MNLLDNLLRMLRNDKCAMHGCNEPRKKGVLLPSAFCVGHWYVNIVQPTMSQGGKEE